MGEDDNINLSDNCKECVTQEFQDLSKSVLSFSDGVIKGLMVENRLLIIILGVVAVGAEVMKLFVK